MKKLTLFLLLTLISFYYIDSSAQSFIYKSNKYNYTITLPTNWVEIPKSTIDKVYSKSRISNKNTSYENPNYEAGFQKEAPNYFTYPYLLILFIKLNTANLPDEEIFKLVVESMEDYATKGKIEINILDNILNVEILDTDALYYDKNRKVGLICTEADSPNIGKLKGLIASFIGKYGVTNIMFYSKMSEYSLNFPIFKHIIDSFKYDSGYEYTTNEFEQLLNILKYSLKSGINQFAAIIGLTVVISVITLLYYIIPKILNKKNIE